jgi:hypothetical protein
MEMAEPMERSSGLVMDWAKFADYLHFQTDHVQDCSESDEVRKHPLYHSAFNAAVWITRTIACGIQDGIGEKIRYERPRRDKMTELANFSGPCSWFGGPDDEGVAPDENLAFLFEVEDKPEVFLATQPKNTTGLARRLNPEVFYVACRWDYDVTPKSMLADTQMARVTAPSTGRSFLAHPTDWGPHNDTGRAADLSPGLLEALGIKTDALVEVSYPHAPLPLLPQRPTGEPRPVKERPKLRAIKKHRHRVVRKTERRKTRRKV